jgi:hypothetical protein
MKVEVLTTAAKTASLLAQREAVVQEAISLIGAATTEDNYESAECLGQVASAAVRRVRNASLANQVATLNREVQRTKAAYEAAEKALAVLETAPANATANLTAGKFYCLVKGDWQKGIPMLALGSDSKLADLARKELAQPASADGQVAMGDGWWDAAQAQQDADREAMQLRAATWYETALPSLGAGLQKAKVQKRLKEASEIERVLAIPAATDVQPGESLPRGKWIDVLPWADIEKDRNGGQWSRQGGAAVAQRKGGRAGLVLPIRVQGSFDLDIQFTAVGQGTMIVVIPVGKRNVNVVFASRNHGLTWVNGKDSRKSPFSRRDGTMITGGDYRVEIVVRVAGEDAAIVTKLNGEPCFQWKGKQSSLAGSPRADKKRPELRAWDSQIAFRRAAIRLVEGTATRLARQ